MSAQQKEQIKGFVETLLEGAMEVWPGLEDHRLALGPAQDRPRVTGRGPKAEVEQAEHGIAVRLAIAVQRAVAVGAVPQGRPGLAGLHAHLLIETGRAGGHQDVSADLGRSRRRTDFDVLVRGRGRHRVSHDPPHVLRCHDLRAPLTGQGDQGPGLLPVIERNLLA